MSGLGIDPNNQGQVNGYLIRALEDLQESATSVERRLQGLEEEQIAINLRLAAGVQAAQSKADGALGKRTGVLVAVGTLVGSVVAGFLGGKVN